MCGAGGERSGVVGALMEVLHGRLRLIRVRLPPCRRHAWPHLRVHGGQFVDDDSLCLYPGGIGGLEERYDIDDGQQIRA